MEDLFSVHEGASVMRNCLIAGTVLEIMSSAFKVGIRSATGVTGYFFAPDEGKNINVDPAMAMASSMLRNCFTWVTFLRDTILAVGVYMACVFDQEDEVIGKTWRTCGFTAAAVGVITSVCEFLKVINYRTFDNLSNFTYVIFFILYNLWIYYYGMHCATLGSAEDKKMLGDDSSASEISDGDIATEEPAVIPAEAPKKKRHHKERKEESDDDV